jgi:pilus assembly protein CpaB
MRRQTLIALGVAIILGVLAVFLANSYLSGRERQLAASPEGMVRVAVATAPLAYGTDITPDKVKFVQYPQASLPPGTFKSMA